ncbi:MAG: YgiT-type zinc finger protein [Planctomycetes bacterium]|nr:YgiT-type zinc finger protein [Planctomycetota bacterium]
MIPVDCCPVCGGDITPKQVEKLLRGGKHTAVVRVEALVCLGCGERLYDEATVRRFEEIRGKLERQDTGEFRVLGQSFQVA